MHEDAPETFLTVDEIILSGEKFGKIEASYSQRAPVDKIEKTNAFLLVLILRISVSWKNLKNKDFFCRSYYFNIA